MSATAVKEKPILFSGPMVQALLSGHKTQTRRVAKNFPDWVARVSPWSDGGAQIWNAADDGMNFRECPYGRPGDRLWVRETWAMVQGWEDPDTRSVDTWTEWTGPMPKHRPEGWTLALRGDGWWDTHVDDRGFNWRPSIFMPRWASRILLEITEVRVERLQDISEADAIAEGIRQAKDGSGTWIGREGPGRLVTPWLTAKEAYADLWDSINGAGSWKSNEWVWVITFRRLESSP